MSKEALSVTSQDHLERHITLSHVGGALLFRFQKTKSRDDLEAAIDATRNGLKSTPCDHPRRTTYLNNLAFMFEKRFELTGSKDDFDVAANAYEEAVAQTSSPPLSRILCATHGSRFIALKNIHLAAKMLSLAVELLPSANLRTLHRHDQQFQVSRISELGAESASLSILAGNTPVRSIQLLEQARGVMASVHLETRGDVAQLQATHSNLAEKYKALCDELTDDSSKIFSSMSSAYDSKRVLKSQNARRSAASKEFDDTLNAIRRQAGFARFLLGPNEDELREAASEGPIVFLSASRFSSDSFLITKYGTRHMPLPMLTYKDLQTNSRKLLKILEESDPIPGRQSNASMAPLLEWLWKVAIEHILEDGLGFKSTPQSDEAWPHVWWIPVGLLNLFPIHAAGHHSDGSGRTTMDRVISSYVPTVSALRHARNQLQKQAEEVSPKVLLVSMPTTPKRPPLPFAEEEIKHIYALFPVSVEKVIRENPTKAEVLQDISVCSIAHFACHGEWDVDPSRSKILFLDWETNPFSFVEMSKTKLDHAQLAYLSACHAANNRALTLLDEAIHMVGACQLAGFPIAVGTLWQISDMHSATVARYLYSAILVDGRRVDVRNAARGLHFAIQKIREQTQRKKGSKTLQDLMTWAPYVHVGV